MTDWQPIETAPKDGTQILIINPQWKGAVFGRWGKYPGGFVEDSNGNDVVMEGWVFDSYTRFFGLWSQQEEGFLGWNDDEMPTHWIYPPAFEEKTDD